MLTLAECRVRSNVSVRSWSRAVITFTDPSVRDGTNVTSKSDVIMIGLIYGRETDNAGPHSSHWTMEASQGNLKPSW